MNEFGASEKEACAGELESLRALAGEVSVLLLHLSTAEIRLPYAFMRAWDKKRKR